MIARARCPVPECAEVFEVQPQQLGRNVCCPACGVRMTARPPEVAGRLVAQQERISGGAGCASVPRLPLAVLLDNVRSLWNVGSIFRSADGCGVAEMLLAGITGTPPRPQIAKTALGAEQAVAWSYRADPLEALDELLSRGYVPVALETSAAAVSIEELDWPARPGLVIGNEVTGISPPLLARCDLRASIPMRGVKDSFNVAVAFGIAAHHAARRLAARAQTTSVRVTAADGRRG